MLTLQQTTPNTTDFLILGYSVFFIVSGLYLFSLWLRQRKLLRDLAEFSELEKNEVQELDS